MMNGTGTDSAHMALDSDCFSNATVSTRSWMPASTSDAATIAVEPPTEPAVCTRSKRLAGRSERLGEVQLGHHDALEQIGRLADDDRVDVVERQLGVGQRAVDGLAQEPGHRDVTALGAVVGLADTDDGSQGLHARPSIVSTRFCCRAGPDVACASAR